MLKSGVIYIVAPRLFTSTIPGDTINYCVVEMNAGTPNIVFGSPSGSTIQPTKLSACVLGSSGCTSTLFTSSVCTLKLDYSYSREITPSDKIKIQISSYHSPLNYQAVNGFWIITSETVAFTEGKIDTLGQNGDITFS